MTTRSCHPLPAVSDEAGVRIQRRYQRVSGHAMGVALYLAAALAGSADPADGPGATSTDDQVHTVHMVPLFPSAADGVRQGFVRVINHSDHAGEVRIDAVDDAGDSFGPLVLSVGPEQTAHFNSSHLEGGDADRGWDTGTGPGEGDWRLMVSSDLDIEVLSYIRLLQTGFVTAMHDAAPPLDGDSPAAGSDEHAGGMDDDHADGDDGDSHDDGRSDHDGDADHAYRVAIFNPGSNTAQVSRLRVINAGDEPAEVTVSGVDDRGHASMGSVSVSVPAGVARTLSAQELEVGGERLEGALGDGGGKWRLTVRSHEPVTVLSLLQSPTGHLTNLSTVPTRQDAHGPHLVPLFPAADDAFGRQGFVRVINHDGESGDVEVHAFDDSGREFGPITLSLGGNEAAHFNSNDLELGNADKGLSAGLGSGDGAWRLSLESDLEIVVLAYIRTTQDGFLTSMHDTVPTASNRHRVVFFNPASNPDLPSWLRLVNPGDHTAAIEIAGKDDTAQSPGDHVALSLRAGGAVTLTSTDLENGTDDIAGALGDGSGKWQLEVRSDEPVIAMSLLSSTAGYLTNLSAGPAHGAREETAEAVFRERISAPILQAKCINCHVAGGPSGNTRLVFAPSSQADHESANFRVFRDFLGSDDYDEHDDDASLDHVALILAKMQGMENHGGGVQVTAGTEDFDNMAHFLSLLRAEVDAEELEEHDDDHD